MISSPFPLVSTSPSLSHSLLSTLHFVRSTLPPKPKQRTRVIAVLTGKAVGLKLAETPEGLRVKGFLPSFDTVGGKDIAIGDYLMSVNGHE